MNLTVSVISVCFWLNLTIQIKIDFMEKKQGPQGPHKLSSLKSLKTSPISGIFTPATNRKDEDMVEKAKRDVSD